jgi:endonuclease/exonuclease/phosphatase family metal-dependent hydrolase
VARRPGAGYRVVSSIDQLTLPYPPPPYTSPPFPPRPTDKQIQRKYANLIAARSPITLTRLAGLSFGDHEEARLSFPEKFLAAEVTTDGMTVHVHNAHLPPGVSRGLIKVHCFEAIRRRVDEDLADGCAVVLCGDFNAPVTETADGPQPQKHRGWHGQSARWQAAESRVIQHDHLRDVFREVHDRAQPLPASHFTGPRRRSPHRYDHIFSSRNLGTQRCGYVGDWLRDGLSDHAPIFATLVPTTSAIETSGKTR